MRKDGCLPRLVDSWVWARWWRQGSSRSRAFDGVIDFHTAVRDPQDPQRMLPKYDSGDHLHPGDAGYRRMADTVDLRMLLRDR